MIILALTITLAATVNVTTQYIGDQNWFVAFDRTYWEATGIVIYHFSSGMWRKRHAV